MKGTLKKIEKKDLKTRDGKKFTIVEFTCDVKIDDKGNIRTLKGKYGIDFAKKYFAYCGVQTKDLINKEVECVTAKRQYENAQGETRTITYIKYLNVLDKDGNSIVLPKDDVEALDF